MRGWHGCKTHDGKSFAVDGTACGSDDRHFPDSKSSKRTLHLSQPIHIAWLI